MVASEKTLGSALVSLLASMLLACLLICLDSSAERAAGVAKARRGPQHAVVMPTQERREPSDVMRFEIVPPEAAAKRRTAMEQDDHVRALALLDVAATLGDAGANDLLLEILWNGVDGPENPQHAFELLLKEAQRGNPRAMRRMGTLNEEGRYLRQDDVAAYLWFKAAAMNDGRARFDANRIQARMSPTEWAVASERGFLHVGAFIRALRVDDYSLMLRSRVEPIYPEPAFAERIEGHVILQARIDERGIPRDLTVLHCSHPGVGFEQAARKAVRQWSYGPPTIRSNFPFEVYTTMLIEFELPRLPS